LLSKIRLGCKRLARDWASLLVWSINDHKEEMFLKLAYVGIVKNIIYTATSNVSTLMVEQAQNLLANIRLGSKRLVKD
jgi:hypothetical protein